MGMRFHKNDILQIIYVDQNGKLTQRFVRVLAVTKDLLVAYCYYRKRPRSFSLKNILAAQLEHRASVMYRSSESLPPSPSDTFINKPVL